MTPPPIQIHTDHLPNSRRVATLTCHRETPITTLTNIIVTDKELSRIIYSRIYGELFTEFDLALRTLSTDPTSAISQLKQIHTQLKELTQ